MPLVDAEEANAGRYLWSIRTSNRLAMFLKKGTQMSQDSSTPEPESNELRTVQVGPAQLEFARVIAVELVRRWMERSSTTDSPGHRLENSPGKSEAEDGIG